MAWDVVLEEKILTLTPVKVLKAMHRHIDPKNVKVVMTGRLQEEALY